MAVWRATASSRSWYATSLLRPPAFARSPQVYGWTTDAATGLKRYLFDSAFGKTWRDNGSSSVEVDSPLLGKFYRISL